MSIEKSALDIPALQNVVQEGWGKLTLARVLSALALLAVCVAAVQLAMALLGRLLAKSSKDTRLRRTILRIVRTVLYVITGIIVASSLGIDVTSLVALVSIFGLAVSLAVKDMLSNVASGIVMVFSKPFSLGDYIATADGEGVVDETGLVHTCLHTLDGYRVMLPNSRMAAGKIVNYTALGRRRVVHTVSASYDNSADAVYAACRKAVSRTPHVLEDPAPQVVLSGYGESAVEYQIRFWVPVEHYEDAYFASLEQMGRCFAEDGVTMPYNHLNVHIAGGEGK